MRSDLNGLSCGKTKRLISPLENSHTLLLNLGLLNPADKRNFRASFYTVVDNPVLTDLEYFDCRDTLFVSQEMEDITHASNVPSSSSRGRDRAREGKSHTIFLSTNGNSNACHSARFLSLVS